MEKLRNTSSSLFKFLLILLFSTPLCLGFIGNDKEVPRKKIFVFGDSYSDTGNWKKGTGSAWNPPYGSTFPGEPTGRFSDGRILTDFMALHLGIGSPVPYEQRTWQEAIKRLRFGMNFAYGGTGVFDGDVSGPNMSTQIDYFQAYPKHHLESSIALVTLCGNDYANFIKSGSLEDIAGFTRSVVKKLVADLNRIHKLGVPKIAVTGLEPLGCLPTITSFMSYLNCSDTINGVAQFHNRLLELAVGELNKENEPDTFLFLDLYGAFMSGMKRVTYLNGNENPLEPCCQGVSNDYKCGSMENEEKKYTVCSNPGAAFFWDSVHPTQNGWHQLFFSIQSSLKTFL